MNDPWIWTTVWELTVGMRWVEEGKGGKTRTTVIDNKKNFKENI